MYPDKDKTLHPTKNCWVRKLDCDIAEKIGYKWYPVNKKTDFCGFPFEWVLANEKPDLRYVLEPDAQVPNFSTNLLDAIIAARKMGWDSINILSSNKKMCIDICEKINV